MIQSHALFHCRVMGVISMHVNGDVNFDKLIQVSQNWLYFVVRWGMCSY